MKIIFNNKEINIKENTKVLDLLSKEDLDKYYACKINNSIKDLAAEIKYENSKIELLDLSNYDACRIYEATLRYVICYAIKRLYKNSRIIFNYSVSRSLFANVTNLNRPFTTDDLKKIKNEVDLIVKENYKIQRIKVSKEKAKELYHDVTIPDMENIIKYRPDKTVSLYECNGYKNYMFSHMLPYTGMLKYYNFIMYSPGFIIQYPRSENKGLIPVFEDDHIFSKTLREANIWGNIVKSNTVCGINKIIEEKKQLELINICETRHNNILAELGKIIHEKKDDIRLICVAGPSSSGKTTFTNRLRIELISRGIKPLMISIDNYYKQRNLVPLDEDGKPDLEHIDALDRELFNDNIYKLINQEEVDLPIYDFSTSTRSYVKAKLEKNQVILIEGIHALNDLLTPSIPHHNKFKIYIAPHCQYHINEQNPISISDVRLIRRIVRDHEFRNYDCKETLNIWPSVRKGEFRWIYDFEEKADFVFDSSLGYELAVLKDYALPLLEKITKDEENYITANRLIKFLKYYKSISPKWIPCNSILREFIGDSIFYTEDIE